MNKLLIKKILFSLLLFVSIGIIDAASNDESIDILSQSDDESNYYNNDDSDSEVPGVLSFDGTSNSIVNFKRKFGKKAHLQGHEKRVRTGEKPFKCDFDGCNKSFAQNGNLIDHKKIHTGEKPFKCDFDGCDKSFAQNANLINHKKIHTGEKPFKCNFDGCGKSFTQSSHLIDHKKIHTRENPFKCDICQSTFTQNSNLKTHKKRIHNINNALMPISVVAKPSGAVINQLDSANDNLALLSAACELKSFD